MAAYQLKRDDSELANLLSRAEAGEEIALERDGTIIAKIIPFRADDSSVEPRLRPYGLNVLGLKGQDTSWLDAPLDEETQRAFGMKD